MNGTLNTSPYPIAPYADRPLRRGLGFGASLRWPALAAAVLLIGAVGATLAQPVFVSWVIDRGGRLRRFGPTYRPRSWVES